MLVVVFIASILLFLVTVALVSWVGCIMSKWVKELPRLNLDARSLCNSALVRLCLSLAKSPRDPFEWKVRELEILGRVKVVKPLVQLAVCGQAFFFIWDFLAEQRWRLVAQSWSGLPSEAEVSRNMALWAAGIFQLLVPVLYNRAFDSGLMSSGDGILFCLRLIATAGVVRLWFESLWIDESDYPSWLASRTPYRLATGVMVGEINTATFLNVSFWAVCLRRSSAPYQNRTEVAMYLCTITMIRVVRQAREADIRSMLEAKALRRVEVAADGLLSRLCDAVVHLGEDLRIKQPSPQLATLLLRPTGKGLEGTPISDLSASPAEAERLMSFIRRGVREGAGTLHTSFRDSCASVVKVQLYHIQGCDADDHIFHVVGVCEDMESFRVPPEASATAAFQLGLNRFRVAPSVQESASTLQGSSLPSSGTSVQQSGEVTVCFRPMDDGYPIEWCSEGFARLCGLVSSGTKLLTCIHGKPDAFIEEVQKAVMAWHVSRDFSPCRFSTLRLTPAHATEAGVELRANVVLSMGHNVGTDDVDSWTVLASLSSVRQARRRREPRSAPASVHRTAQTPLDRMRLQVEGDARRRPAAAAAPPED